MAVITISRQFASGGDEVANRLCDLLGYHTFGNFQIEQAAREAGLTEQEVVDFSEENHRVRSFLDRLFENSSYMGYMGMWPDDQFALESLESIKTREERALNLVRKAIWSAYQAGDIVIVGRGGQVILRNQPDVLHVRIEAPFEDRLQRVKEQLKGARQTYNADISSRGDAPDLIMERDATSADYIKRFYHLEWDDAMLYHLVLNTGRMSIEQAAHFIATLATELAAQPAA
jgi:CMP/dCMP kinase